MIFNSNNMYKILAFLKTFVKEALFLFFAISLVLLLFYLRLLPRVARDLWQNINNYQLVILLINLLLIAIHIYLFLKLLDLIPTKTRPWLEKWTAKLRSLRDNFLWLFVNLYKFIWFILEALASKIFRYDDLQYNLLRKLCKNIMQEKYFNTFYKLLLILLLFPKVIFTAAFVYDVFYCHHLNYTFKCIPLLLIPLLEPIITYVFFDFYDTYWPDIRTFVRKKEYPNFDTAIYFFIPEFSVTPPGFVKDFEDFFYNHFVVLQNTQEFLDSYKNWKYNESAYVHISLFLCVTRFFVFIFLLIYGLR